MSVVVAGGTFNVHTATCGNICINCCGYSMEIDPGDFTIDMGEVMPCALSGTDCNGDQTFFSASWSSSDGSVMTVDSSGNVTGVAGGTSTITAQMTEPIEVYTGQICAPEPVCPTAEPGPQTSGATQVNVVVSGISSDITPDGSGNRNLYVHNNNPQHTNITVQVFHELIGSVSQKVTVSLGTFSSSPARATCAYLPVSSDDNIPAVAAAGNNQFVFDMSCSYPKRSYLRGGSRYTNESVDRTKDWHGD